MAVASHGQLDLTKLPPWASRSVDCFEKLEQIGDGPNSQVYKAKEISTGEIVALKKLRISTDEYRKAFPMQFQITSINEVRILKRLKHENIMELKEVVTSSIDNNKYNRSSIYMVFEYMDHDLASLSTRPGVKFTVPQIKCYMKQLLAGLHYCHDNQVLHRDLKGSNLLINNEGVLKLGDFGLALSVPENKNKELTNHVITLMYRPPELLLGATKYGPAVDMWSVGCIFLHLLGGRSIMSGENEADQLNKIFKLCGTPDETNWPGVSDMPLYNNFKPSRVIKRRLRDNFFHFDRHAAHALDLVDRMLTLDPSQRISAKDALAADYFWTEPLPSDPKSLPKYEASHEFQTEKKKQHRRKK